MSRAIIGKLCSKKRNRGQAIYLSLATLIFLSLMTFAAFNISQMTHNKAQTMNAADAGAYTAGISVARDLNFMTYGNRAMVANHVVVGQIVTMTSLVRIFQEFAHNLGLLEPVGAVLSLIPYVNIVGRPIQMIGDAAQKVDEAIDRILPGLRVLIEIQNKIILGIFAMQGAVLVDNSVRLEGNVKHVVRANDRELEVDFALPSGGSGIIATGENLRAFVETFFFDFSAKRGDTHLRDVVRDSRDGFTKQRKWMGGDVPVPFSDAIWFSFYLFHGGTDMSNKSDANYAWVSVDAAEVKNIPIIGDFNNYQNSAISGSTHASDWADLDHGELSSSQRETAHYKAYNEKWAASFNSRTGRFIPRQDRRYKGGRNNNGTDFATAYDGLQHYWDLKKPETNMERATKEFVVIVYKPIQGSRSTPNANETFQIQDTDSPFNLSEGRKKIYGVAAAQAFFRSPAKSDGDLSAGRKLPNQLYEKGVYASLFSPYWQARLTSMPLWADVMLAAFSND